MVGRNGVIAGAYRNEGCFVHEVGQIGAAHARCAACDQAQVDVLVDLLALYVDVQDLPTVLQLGKRNDHLTVESARPQQGGVQDVRSVGGGDHHDAFAGLEAVHLRQNLVQRLLPLVVPAAHAGAALASDRVDLVDEDDGPAHLACRFEQVADPAGSHAHEHLHEVGTGDREERHARLAGHRPGNERLAGSRRSDQQHALGDAGADLGELLGVLQEVHDLADLHLHALVAGHVVKRRAGAFRGVGLGRRSAYRHHPAHLALGPAAHPPEEQDDQAHGQQQRQPRLEEPRLRGLEEDGGTAVGQQPTVVNGELEGTCGHMQDAVDVGELDTSGQVVHQDVADLVCRHLAEETVVGDLVEVVGREEVGEEEERGDESQDQPDAPTGPTLFTAGPGARRRSVGGCLAVARLLGLAGSAALSSGAPTGRPVASLVGCVRHVPIVRGPCVGPAPARFLPGTDGASDRHRDLGR